MLRAIGLNIQSGRREMSAPAFVIQDHHGNPIALVIEHQPGVTEIFTRRDPDFNDRLRLLSLEPVSAPLVLTSSDVPAGWQPLNKQL